jgi:hypothetical protein
MRMKRVLTAMLLMGCAGTVCRAQAALEMPAWLVPYPGVTAQSRQTANGAETAYMVDAPVQVVLAYFRKLFAGKKLPFAPNDTGDGYFIRVAAAECDLAISIRARDADTAVKVTCSPQTALDERLVQLPAHNAGPPKETTAMKKFDRPVYPDAVLAAIVWPAWLVRVDGAKLATRKGQGQLKSTFEAAPPRGDIEAFYEKLLDLHGYRVMKGAAVAADKFGSWVQATADPDTQLGHKVVIWVKVKPAGTNFDVEITVQ